jgi:hypothetical protein
VATTTTPTTSEQIERANANGTPVVFIHGLWLLGSSWNRWADLPGRNHVVARTVHECPPSVVFNSWGTLLSKL